MMSGVLVTTVHANSSWAVRDIKEAVEAKVADAPVQQQRLLLGTRELRNEELLADVDAPVHDLEGEARLTLELVLQPVISIAELQDPDVQVRFNAVQSLRGLGKDSVVHAPELAALF